MILLLNLFALGDYMVRCEELIKRATEYPSNKSGLIIYIMFLVLFTAVFPFIAPL